MSRIDDLIRELAPEGVTFKALGDVGEFIRGNGLQKSDLTDEGAPAIHYGQVHTTYGTWAMETVSFVDPDFAKTLRRAAPGDLVLATTSEDDEAVAKAVAWLGDEDAAISGDAYIYRHTLDPKYVAYYFQSDQFQDQKKRSITGTKVRRISGDALARIQIPVPPIEVQAEISRILDGYSSFESELQDALTSELTARQKQYDFHWAVLLAPSAAWRSTTLGEVATVFDGPHATPKKTEAGPWYLSISSLKDGRFDLSASAHLGDDEYLAWTRRVTPRAGDTMFSYETRLGQAAYWDRNEPAALGRRMGLLRPREEVIDPRFLTLVYLGPQFQRLIEEKTVSGSTVDRIPIADMASWEISIPSLEEQRRLVRILDKLETAVGGLASSLGREITARRKQYEYYRDRLFTFEESAA